MLAVAEAGWASLLLAAAYNGPHRPAVDLPFLALAVPATAAVVLASWGGRRVGAWWRSASWTQLRGPAPGASPRGGSSRGGSAGGSSPGGRASAAWSLRHPLPWRPLWWRSELVVLAPVAVVGMALSAGVISELTIGGSFTRVAVQPWSTVGHHPAVVAGAAWFVSIVSWSRGFWLGRVTLTARHALWSLALGGVAFLAIFAGRASQHSGPFGAATGAAGWLFFVSFPLAAAAIALVHQRDLERAVLARASSRPSGTWVAVLAAPMAGVALVSLLLAVLVGPAAPTVGRAAAWTASTIWSGLRAAAVWLWDLLPRGHPSHRPPDLKGLLGPAHRLRLAPAPKHTAVTIPAVIGDVLIAIVVLGVAALVITHVHLPRRSRPAAVAGDEERDSLFSWRHLFDQVRAALARLFARFRLRPRRRAHSAALSGFPAGAGVEGLPDPETVREVYRGMLVAAREAGSPRGQAETSHELARRFAGVLSLAPEAGDRLSRLTERYEAVRYGSAADAEAEQAAADAGVVIPAMRAALAEEPGSLGEPTSGSA